MKSLLARLGISLLAWAIAAASAYAGPCDAYFKFDGNLSDSSGSGHDGQMIAEKGVPATPNFVEGRFGQALQFDGTQAMRAFMDLSYEACPQVTVTAWVNVQPVAQEMILSAGSRHYISASSGHLYLRFAGADLVARDAVLPNAGWMFVAATWDMASGESTLHWRSRQVEGKKGNSESAMPTAIWLGALNDALHYDAETLILDEVRVIGRALDHAEILALQEPGSTGSTQVAGSAIDGIGTTRPPLSDGQVAALQEARGSTLPLAGTGDLGEGAACAAPGDCGTGMYCAWDRTCHPENHLPMQNLELQPATVDLVTLPPAEQPAAEPTPEPAASSAGPRPVGPARLTAVAGGNGTIHRTLDLTDSFMTGIRWYESSDRPCQFGITGWKPSPDGNGVVEDREYTEVGGGCNNSIFALFDTGNDVELDRPLESAVGRIEVCNNTNNNFRLKGIRIWGSVVNDDGSVTYMPGGDSQHLTNCDTWSGSVLCGGDQQATGLVLHATQASGDRAQVTGLQLICRSIGT